MGDVGANLQAPGTQIANDVVGVARGARVAAAGSGKIAVGVLTLVAAAVAVATTDALSSGMVALAQMSTRASCVRPPGHHAPATPASATASLKRSSQSNMCARRSVKSAP